MHILFRLAVMAFGLAFLAACDVGPPSPTEIEKTGAPALWRADGPAGPVWLFGSIHALPEGVRWQTDALDQAAAASDRLVIEVLGLEDPRLIAEAFARLGTSDGQPPLSARVDAPLLNRARELQSESGISDRQMGSLESWAAALTFANVATRPLELSGERGVEQILSARFRDRAKPVVALETVEQQLGYFDRLPADDQRALLAAVVRDSDDSIANFRTLLARWLDGDVAGLAETADTGILSRPEIRAAILTGRNRDWARQIDAMVRRGERPLVVVGAAHLAGPDSVQAELAARGYVVERLQ